MTSGAEPISHLTRSINLVAEQGAMPPLSPDQFLGYMEANITPEALINNRPAQAQLAYVLERQFYNGPRIVNGQNTRGQRITIDQEIDLGHIHNPAPVIELKYVRPGSKGWVGTSYVPDGFKLKEDTHRKHYYFFRPGNPSQAVPSYLRRSDVVPSGALSPTFPKDVKAKIREDLGVGEQMLEWLIYNCDERLTTYQVSVDIPFNKPLERVLEMGGPAERFNHVKGVWESTGENYDPGLKAKLAIRLGSILQPKSGIITPPEFETGATQ